jgi:hypothetical protein
MLKIPGLSEVMAAKLTGVLMCFRIIIFRHEKPVDVVELGENFVS